MKETGSERKGSLAIVAIVFVIALLLRARGDARVPPFDDLYHLKRIEFSAAHFPRVLDIDPDRGERGAFTPWPPLYDAVAGGIARLFGGVIWLPPIFFAAFAGAFTATLLRFGPLAAVTGGLTVALSPYLIEVSRAGRIDHHYVEPLLVLLIAFAAIRRSGVLLGVAIAAALFVQTALLVAAAIAFVAMFFSGEPREGAKAFALAAVAVLVYRFTRSQGYPDSAWFLGLPHFALLCGAAVACAVRKWASSLTALAAGAAVALAFPATATAFFTGVRFFGGDPWLRDIVEFQPMFSFRGQYGTDIANLTGGALLGFFVWRRQPVLALFAGSYLLLALSSRRFLVPGIALFAIGGALAVAYARTRPIAIAALLMTLLPPLAYDIYSATVGEVSYDEFRAVGERMRPLPPGRVLAPWSFGHSIDVIGKKAVVIDNFGWMPDRRVFTMAIEAMLLTRESELLRYCRDRGVRYLVLPHPAYIPSAAANIGIDRTLYTRTRLGQRTVWARLHRGEAIAGFTAVSRAAISIWKID